MNFKAMWREVQRKERLIAAQDDEVLKRPAGWKKSWSATHPPYYGTVLCPDKSGRGKNYVKLRFN